MGSGGEENWGKGEKKGRWRRKAGKGERKGKESGFLSSIAGVGSAGHWIKSIADVGSAGQWIKSITVVGIAGNWNFFKINNRRWDCRRCERWPLPPVSKRTSLVIFLKAAFEFGFFFQRITSVQNSSLKVYRY